MHDHTDRNETVSLTFLHFLLVEHLRLNIVSEKEVIRTVFVKQETPFGYIGLFRDKQIDLSNLKDTVLVPEEKRRGSWWDKTAAVYGIKGTSDEAISEALTNYINSFEANVQKHIREINNNLIAKMA